MKTYKKIFLMMILAAVFVLGGCNGHAAIIGEVHDADLKISMLNIGQGDSILIRTKNQTILIDAANVTEIPRFVSELEKFSVTRIDKLILTHPHGDHIGCSNLVVNPSAKRIAEYPYLEKVSVGEVYDNGVVYTSGIYRSYIKSAKEKGIPLRSLKSGDTLDFGGGVKFKVFWPTSDFVATVNSRPIDKKDKEYQINNGSMVGKLIYKDFSMMFTGDCEKESELKIVANNSPADLKCDVLKSGHHGSATSSTKEFVAAVNPSMVLISAGDESTAENPYNGHPHIKPLETYMAAGIKTKNIFCTLMNGAITITSDGKKFSVKPEINTDWVDSWLAGKKARLKK
ncbi:MAG: MBL fold metallo-hydrolase [Quinella sp. 3Q1]|nr:MBL fold metallo-hydrolase [Quinella sp. 3Q1]MBR3051668.1 MBL fold metallo-hydrolase [Selenomonadaceae bacterium]MBR6888997.1 MBL fold metallo-hydrolase [Selenomonadaceae bacterium]